MVLRRWGRTGKPGTCRLETFGSADTAKASFCKVFRAKTGVRWDRRDTYQLRCDVSWCVSPETESCLDTWAVYTAQRQRDTPTVAILDTAARLGLLHELDQVARTVAKTCRPGTMNICPGLATLQHTGCRYTDSMIQCCARALGTTILVPVQAGEVPVGPCGPCGNAAAVAGTRQVAVLGGRLRGWQDDWCATLKDPASSA